MSQTIRPYVYLLIAIIAIIALSFWFDTIGAYDRLIVITIGINMILATSLNLINGFTGQFSLGHAGFMAVGAYTSGLFTNLMAPRLFGTATPEGFAVHGFFLISLLIGGIAASIAGLLVGIPSLRLKGDYLAIVTLGFGEIIRVVIQNIPELGGSLGMTNIPVFTDFNWVFIILALLIFIIQNLMKSTYGKGFLAVRDDEIAAEATGINTTRYKVEAFVIGAFFAGIAGGLYAHYNSLISPADFTFLKSVEIVVMVILGGMGSTWGVLLAAGMLTYLPEWLRELEIGGINFGDFRMSIYALVLIILMIVRPQGLFGDFNLMRWVGRLRSRRQKSEPSLEG